MSILLAELTPTTLPTTQPTTSIGVTITVLAWLFIAIVAAVLLGFFKPRSILGTPRLEKEESAWSLIFVFFSGFFGASVLGNLLNKQLTVTGELRTLILTAVIESSAVLFVLVVMALFRPAGIAMMGLSPRKVPRGFLIALAAIFVLYPLVTATGLLTEQVWQWLGQPQPKPHEVLQSLSESNDRRLIGFSLAVAVFVAPAFEELAFRGILQATLIRLFAWIGNLFGFAGKIAAEPNALVEEDDGWNTAAFRWLAILITAGVFALIHRELAFMPPLFILAIGLGYVYERTANLWAVIFTHAMFNGLQVVIYLYAQ